jgi:hypothetical protein
MRCPTCRTKVKVRPTAPSQMLGAVVRMIASLKEGSEAKEMLDRIAGEALDPVVNQIKSKWIEKLQPFKTRVS